MRKPFQTPECCGNIDEITPQTDPAKLVGPEIDRKIRILGDRRVLELLVLKARKKMRAADLPEAPQASSGRRQQPSNYCPSTIAPFVPRKSHRLPFKRERMPPKASTHHSRA